MGRRGRCRRHWTRRGCGPLAVATIALAVSGAPAPRASAAERPVELRLPPPRVLDRAEGSPAAVVFRHTTHVAAAERRCLVCHPQPFSILGRHEPITHDAMSEGRSCATCHNGRDTWDVSDPDSCPSCHTGVEASSGAGAGPPELTFAVGADSPGPVRFRHATHPAACPTCHPQPFAMRAGASRPLMAAMVEGATCGKCHDGRNAFAADDADRCVTCHAAGEAEP